MTIDVPANQIMWFRARNPGHSGGECPHRNCSHNKFDVVAWGPSNDLYEIIECKKCSCRAWRNAGRDVGQFFETRTP